VDPDRDVDSYRHADAHGYAYRHTYAHPYFDCYGAANGD